MDAWLGQFITAFSPCCPACATALRPDLDQCPRCQVKLQLGMKAPRVYLLTWGVTAGAAVAIAAFGLFVLFLLFAREPLFDTTLERLIAYAISVLGLIETPAAIMLLVMRRHFCRRSAIVRWLLAIGQLLFLVGAFMAFALIAR